MRVLHIIVAVLMLYAALCLQANPWYKDGKTFNDPVGGLAPDQVKMQLRSSLKSLQMDKVSSTMSSCASSIRNSSSLLACYSTA
jgi:hypothetical protein